MKILSLILLFLAGLSVSYILIRESSGRVRDAVKLYNFAEYLEERIVYGRSVLDDIISSYPEGKELFDTMKNGGGEKSNLVNGISTGTFELASSNAALLKKYTEKEMYMVKKQNEDMKRVRAVIPLAAALLAAILLL